MTSRIDEIKKRLEAATSPSGDELYPCLSCTPPWKCKVCFGTGLDAEAKFSAYMKRLKAQTHYNNDLAYCLGEIERLTIERDTFRGITAAFVIASETENDKSLTNVFISARAALEAGE